MGCRFLLQGIGTTQGSNPRAEPAGKPVTILITIFTIVPQSFSQEEGTLSHLLLGESWVLLE